MEIKAVIINGSFSHNGKAYKKDDVLFVDKDIFEDYSKAGIMKLYIEVKQAEFKIAKLTKSKRKK